MHHTSTIIPALQITGYSLTVEDLTQFPVVINNTEDRRFSFLLSSLFLFVSFLFSFICVFFLSFSLEYIMNNLAQRIIHHAPSVNVRHYTYQLPDRGSRLFFSRSTARPGVILDSLMRAAKKSLILH
jgi:hypothetical protein